MTAGALQIATQPSTGSNGDFYTENRIVYELIGPGQTNWTDSDQIEHAGTYYLRIDGWDPQYGAGAGEA